MRHYVIDTNALLSFVTDRSPAQQAVMTTVFEQVAAARAAVLCPQNVIAEFVYVMDTVYRQPKPLIKSIIADFISLPGVTTIEKPDLKEVLSLWPELIDDFGDAIVAASAASIKGAVVITFDRRFMRALTAHGISFKDHKMR